MIMMIIIHEVMKLIIIGDYHTWAYHNPCSLGIPFLTNSCQQVYTDIFERICRQHQRLVPVVRVLAPI